LQLVEETIFTSPVTRGMVVRVLDVRSLFTLRVSKPSGVILQLQHSDSSCFGSNT
jgi:hypothetical protein